MSKADVSFKNKYTYLYFHQELNQTVSKKQRELFPQK